MPTENFEIIQADVEWGNRPIKDIIEDSKTIDLDLVATEVLEWIAGNVESFVDSSMTAFKIDLILDSSDTMQETKRLQDLYRAIPDDEDRTEKEIEEAQQCRREIDKTVENVYNKMLEKDELLNILFNRLIFFYERLIPIPENKERALQIDEELKELILSKEESNDEQKDEIQKRIVEKIKEGESLIKYQAMEGGVDITKFEYEAFNVGVKVLEPVLEDPQGENRESRERDEENIIKAYMIPEGFTIGLELSYHLKQRPTSMF